MADIKIEIKGQKELMDAMRTFEKEFRTEEVIGGIYHAGRMCMKAGSELTARKGGEGWQRAIVKKANKRTFAQTNFKSERTSGLREASYFVVIKRQNKKPVFVPITPNPYSRSANPSEYRAAMAARFGKKHGEPWGVRRGGKADYGDDRRGDKFLDRQSEVSKLRKISRRGFASASFAHLSTKVKAKGQVKAAKMPKTFKAANMRKDIMRWTKFSQRRSSNRPSIRYTHNSEYIPKHWPHLQARLYMVAADKLEKDIRKRMFNRANKLNKARGRTARRSA